MQPVEVRYVGRQRTLTAAGMRSGDVLAFWWGFTDDGEEFQQLSYLLIQEWFLICQPVNFPTGQAGWWYCDLVRARDEGDRVEIEDLYVDLLVGPATLPYRVLDLHELADAVTAGLVPAEIAMHGLTQCQRFLDRRLNRRHDVTPTWPDFPPDELHTIDPGSLPRSWYWTPR